MGLSDDQRAMLRLLAQRGEQGYEDIAALKGLSVDEVRAQVAQALAQLDEEGALAPSAPQPGTAPEKPVEEPKADSESVETPKPAAPEPKAAAPAPARPRRAKPQRSGSAPKLTLPGGSGLRAAIAAGIAVLALIAIVLIVSGDDGESTSSSTPTAAESNGGAGEEIRDAANSDEVTKAVLEPVDGSDAEGVAIFGKVEEGKKEKLALEIAVD